jgi:hypothetical protein
MVSTITSNVTNILYLDNVSIQLNFTGTPTGGFAIQGSLDYAVENGTPTNAGNWVPLALTPNPAAAGSAGTILLNLTELSFPWIRVVYTPSSGTGTLDAYISAKQV